jgi:hypothetical protein
MKSRGIPVNYINLDPAGENHKLGKHTDSNEWADLQPFATQQACRIGIPVSCGEGVRNDGSHKGT